MRARAFAGYGLRAGRVVEPRVVAGLRARQGGVSTALSGTTSGDAARC
jgi:hypothetical protein